MITPRLRKRIGFGLGAGVGLAVAAAVLHLVTGQWPGETVNARSAANPLIPADILEQRSPIAGTPAPGVTAAYGRHLVSITLCGMCHGADLRGRPPIREGLPPAPDIAVWATPGVWSETQFLRAMRTGVTPWGRRLDPNAMPWKVYSGMTDAELRAIWQYVVFRAERNARDREDRVPAHP
jgi:cytochrome c5